MNGNRVMTLVLTLACVCLLTVGFVAGIARPAESAKPAPRLTADEQKLLDSIDGDYAWDLADRLSSLPYNYLGEVVPGSPEDLQTAGYVADEMRTLGLMDVTVESFNLVNWDYRSASLEILSPDVPSKDIRTRSMANSPSTPNGQPVEGNLAYVGMGRAQDYEQVPGGVEGKVVIIDRSVVMYYTTPAVREAAYRGAIAALIHNMWRDPAAINVDVAHNNIPTMSISGNDAMYLKDLLLHGDVRVRLAVDNRINEDAQAHAVYGMIRGSEYPNEYVVLEGHMDHWWSGANDDNGGLAASLAVAKAILDTGITPKRTFVFMALSGHESGTGGTKDSHWDWGLGGYYFMNVLHPEWASKVVGSFISDGGGVAADWMFIETTPEIGGLLKRAAFDARVQDLMVPIVFTPVSSFDSWGFYMAGVPTSTAYYGALSGIVEEAYYHTDLSGMDLIHPEYLKKDAAFRGLAAFRLAQASILPYELGETSKEVREAVYKLLDKVPEADLSALLMSLNGFETAAKKLQSYVDKLKNPTKAEITALNAKMLSVISTVNPVLWDQDVGVENPYPGWCSVSKFDTYTNDMPLLDAAVEALKSGDARTALRSLEGVVTMGWGEHVSYQVWLDCVWLFNGTPYLNWATDHLPWVTNIHQEYTSIKAEMKIVGADYSAEVTSISAKLELLHEKLGLTAMDVKLAFDEGTILLALA